MLKLLTPLTWVFIGECKFPKVYSLILVKGYYATTYVGFDSDRFTQVGRWADLAWGSFYGIAAPQVKVVEDIATENGNNVAMGMAKVVKVNGYSRMTDYWGPVPYSHLEMKNYLFLLIHNNHVC